jgi:arginyl-tRNA synthetase
MDIKLTEMGESYYNPMLAPLVHELEEKGFVEQDKGAKIIKIPG